MVLMAKIGMRPRAVDDRQLRILGKKRDLVLIQIIAVNHQSPLYLGEPLEVIQDPKPLRQKPFPPDAEALQHLHKLALAFREEFQLGLGFRQMHRQGDLFRLAESNQLPE